MRYVMMALLLLTACTAAVEKQPEAQCDWPEIPSNGECCRDLNENSICDTVDFAEEIEQQKQQEYEESAKKALEKAKQSGTLKKTIMNELYDNASTITNYRFLYNGDEVVVDNEKVTRKLINEYDLGIQEIEGRRQKVILNMISFDFAAKTATGTCAPKALAEKEEFGSPCDAVIGMEFEVPYEEFAFRLPIEWVKDFLHRTPFEALPGTEISRQQTTLFRFTDLQDANRITNLWIEIKTNMPVRVEVWQDGKLVRQEYHTDLYAI